MRPGDGEFLLVVFKKTDPCFYNLQMEPKIIVQFHLFKDQMRIEAAQSPEIEQRITPKGFAGNEIPHPVEDYFRAVFLRKFCIRSNIWRAA